MIKGPSLKRSIDAGESMNHTLQYRSNSTNFVLPLRKTRAEGDEFVQVLRWEFKFSLIMDHLVLSYEERHVCVINLNAFIHLKTFSYHTPQSLP